MSAEDLNEQLVERLRQGDDEAFVELFTKHRRRLKHILEFRMDRRLKGREDPSDVLQEVFLDARQRLHHFVANPRLSFFVWLRQLTTQRLIDEHRRHIRARMRTARQEVSLQPSAATSVSLGRALVAKLASPSQEMEAAELVCQVAAALEKLDPMDREVLALRHFEELKNSEVAEMLGIKQAAASNRYVRALTRLKEVIEQCPFLTD